MAGVAGLILPVPIQASMLAGGGAAAGPSLLRPRRGREFNTTRARARKKKNLGTVRKPVHLSCFVCRKWGRHRNGLTVAPPHTES